MIAVLKTAPTIEPITLAQAKEHLGLSSGTTADNLTTYQSILPGSHAIANNYTTHVGTGALVVGKEAIVNLSPGTIGAGGTVDAKIQDSDDNATWADWTGGAFTQVTGASHALQEKAYTGTKAYIRVVAKVLVAACEFGADVVVNSGITAMDNWITRNIETARTKIEHHSRRQLISATYNYYPSRWPGYNDWHQDRIKIPYGNLQTVASIKYKDCNGTETTMDTADYIVETNGDQCGFIVLAYGKSWPSVTLYPSKPINIEYDCGYGDDAANVPGAAKSAILLYLTQLWVNRGDLEVVGSARADVDPDRAVKNLINIIPRLYDEEFL